MGSLNATARKVVTNTFCADIKPLVNSSLSFNEGDFLFLNSSTHLLAKPAGETDGANFVGVAACTIVNGKPVSSISTDVDSSIGIPSIPGPTYGDEYIVTLKSGAVFHPGDTVYIDPATATNGVTTTGSNPVGVFVGKQVTGTGTNTGIAKLGCQAPNNVLKF